MSLIRDLEYTTEGNGRKIITAHFNDGSEAQLTQKEILRVLLGDGKFHDAPCDKGDRRKMKEAADFLKLRMG